MQWLVLITMLVPFPADAQASTKDDAALFRQAMSRDAFNEMRCRGISAERTKRLYNRRYAARQERISAAILAARGPRYLEDGEVIPIGRQCPYYRGAEKRLRQALTAAEKRLGIKNR